MLAIPRLYRSGAVHSMELPQKHVDAAASGIMRPMLSSSARPLRVGVIGTGFGATVHVPAFNASPDFEVVAIVSRHKENAERVAEDHGIGWAGDDYRSMLR